MFVLRISYIVLRTASILRDMTHGRRHVDIVNGLCMVVFFLSAATSSANAIVTTEDINNLAEIVKLTADTFMQESFELRMGYEYSGRFLQQDDKENLQKIAKIASDRLEEIAENQKRLKQQIEDYEGNDWNAKYGSTGLWRKLATDLYTATLSKCEIDFYSALTTEQPQRNEILRKILREIDKLCRIYEQFGPILTKGRVLAVLSQTETVYKSPAIKELEAFEVYSDISSIRAAIEKIKLVGSAKPNELSALVRFLEQNRRSGDLELVLPLAFLQRQYDPAGFEKTIRVFPEIQDFLGTLILSDISTRIVQQKNPKQISVFEAELAVQAAWKNEAKDHKMLLDYLSSTEKFQTPLVLYITAISFADSSPTKAVALLVKASRLQQLQKSDMLDVEADKIAKQAAQLAYNLFVENSSNCPLTLSAFENYFAIANGKIDEKLEYLYTIVLNNCGREEKSKALLEKIANRPAGSRRSRARLDRIIQTIRQGNLRKKQYNALFWRLDNLLADCSENQRDRQLRAEAITIYCQLLLELKDKISSQKVLNILSQAETAHNPNLNVFKSTALRRLGKLDESVHCLLKAIEPTCCDYADEAMELLLKVTEEIDRFEKDLDFMKNCKKLAQFCCDCLDGQLKQRALVFLIEISVFPATETEKKLSGFEELLYDMAKDGLSNDIDFIRCKARLLAEQGKFRKAAELWSKICEIRKGQAPSPNQRSPKWWRAKFYELHCWAKLPQTEKEVLLHNIDILENSFANIPPLWAEKLSLLKRRCRSQLIGTGKGK